MMNSHCQPGMPVHGIQPHLALARPLVTPAAALPACWLLQRQCMPQGSSKMKRDERKLWQDDPTTDRVLVAQALLDTACRAPRGNAVSMWCKTHSRTPIQSGKLTRHAVHLQQRCSCQCANHLRRAHMLQGTDHYACARPQSPKQ